MYTSCPPRCVECAATGYAVRRLASVLFPLTAALVVAGLAL